MGRPLVDLVPIHVDRVTLEEFVVAMDLVALTTTKKQTQSLAVQAILADLVIVVRILEQLSTAISPVEDLLTKISRRRTALETD